MNPSTENIEQAITNGIGYLHNHQLPNGEFCTYFSGDDAMQGWIMPMGMIFPTALICQSLLFLKQYPQTEEMLSKSAVFLRYQIGRNATWNHFTNFHPLRTCCPQDVDDTVCVSSFLLTRYSDFASDANYKIICDNRAKNGLFYTWFAFRFRFNPNVNYWRLSLSAIFKNPVKAFAFWKHEAGRYDIDAVVNANVLYYLGDTEITQPVIQHLIKIITDHREADCDTWYRNPYSVYYFISRNYYKGIHKLQPVLQPIIDRILSSAQADGQLGNSLLDTALAACTLLNLHYQGPSLANAIRYIISKQKSTGEWERWLLYYGGPKKRAGYGGEELTTGFCLEALARFTVPHAYS